MNDRQLQRLLLGLTLFIAVLLLPLQVFGDTGLEESRDNELQEGILIPMKYDYIADTTKCEEHAPVYRLNGAEDLSADPETLLFDLPSGDQEVVLTIENLYVYKTEDLNMQSPILCDYRLAVKRLNPKEETEVRILIHRKPLPTIHVSGNAGVSLSYGLYQAGASFHTPLMAEVTEDFRPPEQTTAPETEPKQGNGTNVEDGTVSDSSAEEPAPSEEREKHEVSAATEPKTVQEIIEPPKNTEPIERPVQKPTVQHQDKAVLRTSSTTITKPLNHVKLTEKLTSGNAKIEQDSIRVRHNGADVTENCLIHMTEDGFQVDTQMNTNRGDQFVTTYKAIPTDDNALTSVSDIDAEEEGDEEKSSSGLVSPPHKGHASANDHQDPKHKAMVGIPFSMAIAISIMLRKLKEKWGGKLCIRKILNFGL